ncbi:hypothetical protein LK12_18090 [Novosphingobium malaysiense]|uniref:Uncharacterized protein n=1 Tax=Novosphingobium malaysiense TaxID=1348853 RepID=A0A0B1ZKG5_9SPHN|nr:hypothetical protein LK12_18090 [Novosphingobium malaysiense]
MLPDVQGLGEFSDRECSPGFRSLVLDPIDRAGIQTGALRQLNKGKPTMIAQGTQPGWAYDYQFCSPKTPEPKDGAVARTACLPAPAEPCRTA